MAWLCKALASSGISDYKKTLEMVANTTINPKLQKYAAQSLGMVEEYARRNAIMADNRYAGKNLSPEIIRYINMLKSDIPRLKKDAAKKVSRSNFTDHTLFDVISEELLKGCQIMSDDREHIDAMAWLCKALAASGMAKYKAVLEQVVANSGNPKLQKYAQQSLDLLDITGK